MDFDLITSFKHCKVDGFGDLNARAQKMYEAKCRELIKSGEMRRGYTTTLIAWADNYARYLELKHDVETEGYTFVTRNRFGNEIINANPKVKMMNDSQKMANSILADFGATLTKARKLGKQAPAPKTALEAFDDEE